MFETVTIPLVYAVSGERVSVPVSVARFYNAIRSRQRVYRCYTRPSWKGRFAMDQVTRCRQCEQTPVPMQGWDCGYCQSFEPWYRADRWIELSDTRSSYRLLVRVLRAWRAVLVVLRTDGGGLPMTPSPWDDLGKWRE